MLAYTLSMCDRMILSILFPDIKAEFGLSDTQLGLLGFPTRKDQGHSNCYRRLQSGF
jgi:hypothetical protein